MHVSLLHSCLSHTPVYGWTHCVTFCSVHDVTKVLNCSALERPMTLPLQILVRFPIRGTLFSRLRLRPLSRRNFFCFSLRFYATPRHSAFPIVEMSAWPSLSVCSRNFSPCRSENSSYAPCRHHHSPLLAPALQNEQISQSFATLPYELTFTSYPVISTISSCFILSHLHFPLTFISHGKSKLFTTPT